MATIYSNFQSGTITDNPLSSGATTINSAGFSGLPVVAGGDTLWLVLDPLSTAGSPEVVQVTAHTSSATSATVVRAQQGTASRSHAAGIPWILGVTKSDMDELPFRKMTTTGDILYASGANTTARLAVGTSSQVLGGGTTPAWGSIVKSMLSTSAGELGTSWTTFTPTLTNVTGGTASGSYLQVGKTLFFNLNITAGTATAGGTISATFGGGGTSSGLIQLCSAMVGVSIVTAHVSASDTKVTIYSTTAGGAFTGGASVAQVRCSGVIELV